MEDKDQWVGVQPCVRAGIRSLLRRFEDQQAALDEAAKSQAALLNAHARSEARCEALEAQIVAARREATEARRIAAESSTNVASLAADLAKRPARDEVEARASEAFAAATKDAHAAIAAAEDRFARRSDDDDWIKKTHERRKTTDSSLLALHLFPLRGGRFCENFIFAAFFFSIHR